MARLRLRGGVGSVAEDRRYEAKRIDRFAKAVMGMQARVDRKRTVLAGCRGVKVSQTVGIPDELLGEMVVTCIVRQEDAQFDEQAVRAFVRKLLASYKVPRRVLFVEEDDLGQTGSAKIKTADLRNLVSARLASHGLQSNQ